MIEGSCVSVRLLFLFLGGCLLSLFLGVEAVVGSSVILPGTSFFRGLVLRSLSLGCEAGMFLACCVEALLLRGELLVVGFEARLLVFLSSTDADALDAWLALTLSANALRRRLEDDFAMLTNLWLVLMLILGLPIPRFWLVRAEADSVRLVFIFRFLVFSNTENNDNTQMVLLHKKG